jgi:hypothetical protein
MMESTADRRCTAQRRDGSFCDTPSHPDAPFPICSHHARKAYEFGLNLMRSKSATMPNPGVTALALEAAWPRTILSPRAKSLLPRQVRSGPGVYFIALDGLIKIGASATASERVKQYPPSARVLAIQYVADAFTLEKELHLQFAHLRRAGREWFTPKPDLLAYIKSVQS